MDKEIEEKIEEAFECLSAGEGYDYDRGMSILFNLLNGNLQQDRRGWRKKVKQAYYCFTAEENRFQKGLDLLLQTKGERLAVYVERVENENHDVIPIEDIS